MAFEVATGTFLTHATDETTWQPVSGLSFQPKALILLCAGFQATGTQSDYCMSIGFATGDAADGSVGFASADNVATADTNIDRKDSRTVNCVDPSGTALTRCEFTDFQSDGFRLKTKTVDGNQYKVGYIAFGGTDITNAKAGNFAAPGSTGTQNVTDPGFQPDIVFILGHGDGSSGGGDRDSTPSFGAAIDSSNEFAISATTEDDAGTSNTRRRLRTDRVIYSLNGNGTVRQDADFTGMTATGFDLNYNTSAHSKKLYYLAIAGGEWAIVSDTQKTSTGTKETTVSGIDVKGMLLASVGTTDENETDDNRWSMGAGTSSTSRWRYWHGDSDNVGTSVVDSAFEEDTVLGFHTEGTPTLDAEADIDSVADGSATLDWTTADATARKWTGVFFGETGGGGGGPTVPIMDKHYRMMRAG